MPCGIETIVNLITSWTQFICVSSKKSVSCFHIIMNRQNSTISMARLFLDFQGFAYQFGNDLHWNTATIFRSLQHKFPLIPWLYLENLTLGNFIPSPHPGRILSGFCVVKLYSFMPQVDRPVGETCQVSFITFVFVFRYTPTCNDH